MSILGLDSLFKESYGDSLKNLQPHYNQLKRIIYKKDRDKKAKKLWLERRAKRFNNKFNKLLNE